MVIPASDGRGLSIGLGIGYGIPYGKAADDMGTGTAALSRVISGSVPLSLSAGFRFVPQLHIGMYGSYAPGIGADAPGSACPPTGRTRCTGAFARVGAEIQLHMLPLALIDPWIGVGTGYEFLWVNPGTMQFTFQGWEMVNLQAGADVRIRKGLRIGPFINFTIGRYDYTVIETIEGGAVVSHFSNTALHYWLMAGI